MTKAEYIIKQNDKEIALWDNVYTQVFIGKPTFNWI